MSHIDLRLPRALDRLVWETGRGTELDQGFLGEEGSMLKLLRSVWEKGKELF